MKKIYVALIALILTSSLLGAMSIENSKDYLGALSESNDDLEIKFQWGIASTPKDPNFVTICMCVTSTYLVNELCMPCYAKKTKSTSTEVKID